MNYTRIAVWSCVLVIWGVLVGAIVLHLHRKSEAVLASSPPSEPVIKSDHVVITINEKSGIVVAETTGSGLLIVRLDDGTYMATAR